MKFTIYLGKEENKWLFWIQPDQQLGLTQF